MKSIDLTNFVKTFKYLLTSSLFVGRKVPPLIVLCFIIALLLGSSMLHTYIRCSTDFSPSLQGHIGLSISLNLFKYAFVFP